MTRPTSEILSAADTFYEKYYVARDACRGLDFTNLVFKHLGVSGQQIAIAADKALKDLKLVQEDL